MNQQDKLTELLSENAIDIDAFCACLAIDEKLASELIGGTRAVPKALARQIEQTFSKPKYWLDSEGEVSADGFDLFG